MIYTSNTGGNENLNQDSSPLGRVGPDELGISNGKDIPNLQVFNKKVSSLNQEYTAMLASILESQRVFY